MHICNKYPVKFFSEWEMFYKNVAKKIKTHIFCSITFFRKSCRLWDNVEKFSTATKAIDDNITQCMRLTCRITEAADTHSEYVINIPLPRQQRLSERASVLRYTNIASVVLVKMSLRLMRRPCITACSWQLSLTFASCLANHSEIYRKFRQFPNWVTGLQVETKKHCLLRNHLLFNVCDSFPI
jgi:hypothetical protein